ncbi:MAG: PD-(D/E)XK nuclease domain-containing protein [Roseburia faecis]|jgi:hypothetical protein
MATQEQIRRIFQKMSESHPKEFFYHVDAMNEYMNRVALQTFSYFDTGERALGAEPERFYHGFVRYDVILVPRNLKEGNAVILEFKVRNVRKEKSLEETARSALDQIRERRYSEELKNRGISEERINRYGFAFEGKKVLILDEND